MILSFPDDSKLLLHYYIDTCNSDLYCSGLRATEVWRDLCPYGKWFASTMFFELLHLIFMVCAHPPASFPIGLAANTLVLISVPISGAISFGLGKE